MGIVGRRRPQKRGGIPPNAPLPRVAANRSPVVRRRPRPEDARGAETVVIFPDTFTNFFDPRVGRAAVASSKRWATASKCRPAVVLRLTWLSTGQLGMAGVSCAAACDCWPPAGDNGVPIVGLEPSCTGAAGAPLRLLRATHRRCGSLTRTFAEMVTHPCAMDAVRAGRAARRDEPVAPCALPPIRGARSTPTAPCSARSACPPTSLDAGCCGSAGTSASKRSLRGVHGRRSGAASRGAGTDERTEVLADGFKLPDQIRQGTTRRPLHLAELAAQQWGLDVDGAPSTSSAE